MAHELSEEQDVAALRALLREEKRRFSKLCVVWPAVPIVCLFVCLFPALRDQCVRARSPTASISNGPSYDRMNYMMRELHMSELNTITKVSALLLRACRQSRRCALLAKRL